MGTTVFIIDDFDWLREALPITCRSWKKKEIKRIAENR
jgi:hypothetical protein